MREKTEMGQVARGGVMLVALRVALLLPSCDLALVEVHGHGDADVSSAGMGVVIPTFSLSVLDSASATAYAAAPCRRLAYSILS